LQIVNTTKQQRDFFVICLTQIYRNGKINRVISNYSRKSSLTNSLAKKTMELSITIIL